MDGGVLLGGVGVQKVKAQVIAKWGYGDALARCSVMRNLMSCIVLRCNWSLLCSTLTGGRRRVQQGIAGNRWAFKGEGFV